MEQVVEVAEVRVEEEKEQLVELPSELLGKIGGGGTVAALI